MKHRFKPALWPLVKRFGLIIGIALWWACRQSGCRWLVLPSSLTVLIHFKNPETGTVHFTSLAKIRCADCESVRLVHVNGVALASGFYQITVPECGITQEGWVNLNQ